MAGKTMISDYGDEIGVEDDDKDEDPYRHIAGNRDEHDEGKDEYEKDGFIVEEEQDRVDSEEERHKKKKKRNNREDCVLDEDDYELLQESNISAPCLKPGSKKFKRLKKDQRDSEAEPSGLSDEEEFDGSGKGGRTAEETLKRSSFVDNDGQRLEVIAEEDADISGEGADFIGDEDLVDEHGAPVKKRKLKKSRQQLGISSSALQEAHVISGDGDELLMHRKMEVINMNAESGDRSLKDQFDPSALSETYKAVNDDKIREIDVPERMQISEERTGPPPTDEISIKLETEWIYNQLVTGIPPLFHRSRTEEVDDELKRHIARFLELMHVQKLDVPFVAMYRKEEILSLLKDPNESEPGIENDPNHKSKLKWHKVLWTIQDLDQKWLLLQKRKSALQEYYTKRFLEENRRIDDEAVLFLNQQLYESITKSLKEADSEREVDDVDLKFNMHFPQGDVVLDGGKYRSPSRKSQYSICSEAGLWLVASKFGFSSEQFGLQISLEKMRIDELEDAKETPEEMASNFTCRMFETPQAVLKGARLMAAIEISCEPGVRKHVRRIFMDNAVVSTKPTPDGTTAIDSFHQFAGVKLLMDISFNRLEDAQWLLIQKAEEEKLLQVTIKLPEVVLEKLISDSNEYYLSDGVSKSAQLWNEQRKLILHDAFDNNLLPSMEKEARSLLTGRAKTWLLSEYGRHLWDKVSVSPYQLKENDLSSDDNTAPRVMACCWGPGKPATTFVMLDSSGRILDIVRAGSLSLCGPSINEQQLKENDRQSVRKIIMRYKPHVVVLGAADLACTGLKQDIYEIIFKPVEGKPRYVGHWKYNLNFVYGDESLPRLYENSDIRIDRLPPVEGIIRRAVALGRYLLNPLAMVGALCGPGKEILSWKLHPLEKFLTPDEKYGMVEQVMVDVTNQVSIDIIEAANHEWLFGPLQFVSGLGPRKAVPLRSSLLRTRFIHSRRNLLTELGLGKNIYLNAAGFLRVRSRPCTYLLDETRIHPESYSLAQDLAKGIYREDLNRDPRCDGAAVEHVMYKPHLVRAVDVCEYAERKNLSHKKETLKDIRLELMNGFQDWRRPSEDASICMISGETEEAVSEGRIVEEAGSAQRVMCVL